MLVFLQPISSRIAYEQCVFVLQVPPFYCQWKAYQWRQLHPIRFRNRKRQHPTLCLSFAHFVWVLGKELWCLSVWSSNVHHPCFCRMWIYSFLISLTLSECLNTMLYDCIACGQSPAFESWWFWGISPIWLQSEKGPGPFPSKCDAVFGNHAASISHDFAVRGPHVPLFSLRLEVNIWAAVLCC